MAKRKAKAKAKARPKKTKAKAPKSSKASTIIADLKAQNRNIHKALVSTQRQLAELQSA